MPAALISHSGRQNGDPGLGGFVIYADVVVLTCCSERTTIVAIINTKKLVVLLGNRVQLATGRDVPMVERSKSGALAHSAWCDAVR